MSTHYYVVCWKCRKSVVLCVRTAGGPAFGHGSLRVPACASPGDANRDVTDETREVALEFIVEHAPHGTSVIDEHARDGYQAGGGLEDDDD